MKNRGFRTKSPRRERERTPFEPNSRNLARAREVSGFWIRGVVVKEGSEGRTVGLLVYEWLRACLGEEAKPQRVRPET